MNKYLIISFVACLLLSSTVSSQNVKISGNSKTYAGDTLHFYTYTEYITKDVKPLGSAVVDTAGQFEHLFINWQTEKPYTTISKVWGRLRKKAGLAHLRIHDLRHQYASFLVNDGRTLYEVQQILGHSDPSVTQRYAHLSTKALQDAANSASELIQGAMQDVG